MAPPFVERLVEFITSKKGGMEILLVVDKEQGTPHKEFEKLTDVSKVTISTRLQEAKDYGLMKETQSIVDHGNVTRYKLTEAGEIYRAALESLELDEDYQQLLELQEHMEKKRDVMSEWIQEQEGIGYDVTDSWTEPEHRPDLPGRRENLRRYLDDSDSDTSE